MKTKLLITSMALLCVSATTFAQTEKGNNLIGGAIGFNISKTNDSKTADFTNQTNSLGISPGAAHFFSKNLAIGLSIAFEDSKNTGRNSLTSGNTTSSNESVYKTHTYGLGPFVRYYVELTEKFKFFGQFSSSINFGKSSSTYTTNTASDGSVLTTTVNLSKSKITNFSSSINPGFAIFPSKKWAIEFSFPLLTYQNLTSKDDGSNPSPTNLKTTGFYFGLSSVNPNIGFSYHF